MKLYLSPGTGSLGVHIAIVEADIAVDLVSVDLETKLIDGARKYEEITAKCYVPALEFDDGRLLTENVAILSWVSDQVPRLAPNGEFGRYQLIEALSYISSEIHKRFPIYFGVSETSQTILWDELVARFDLLRTPLHQSAYLFGNQFTVADAYLFPMARGANEMGIPLPESVVSYISRIASRPTVLEAIKREALLAH